MRSRCASAAKSCSDAPLLALACGVPVPDVHDAVAVRERERRIDEHRHISNITAPARCANAIARPPTTVSPGYFTQHPAPRRKSSASAAEPGEPAPVAERVLVPLSQAERDAPRGAAPRGDRAPPRARGAPSPCRDGIGTPRPSALRPRAGRRGGGGACEPAIESSIARPSQVVRAPPPGRRRRRASSRAPRRARGVRRR